MGSIIVPREPKAPASGEASGRKLYAAGLNMLPMGA